jgi:chemotaxis protein MotA
MNISSIFGFLLAIVVLGYAVFDAKGATAVLLNLHAFMIVVGGTMGASFVSFPVRRIFSLSIIALKKLVGLDSYDYSKIIREVISVAEGMRTDPAFAKNSLPRVQNLFFKEGLQLIVNGATEEQLLDIMEARAETSRRRYLAEVNMFRTMGKFPPAFGLLGTTFGMISLLNQLGSPDAQKLIGPSMAVGLTATLYGIAITNFIFIPIAENLSANGADDYAARKMVVEGLVLIKRKTHPLLVEEKMKSYLLPSERAAVERKRGTASAAAPGAAR